MTIQRNRCLFLTIILSFVILLSFLEAGGFRKDLFRYINQQKAKVSGRYTAPTNTQIQLMREAVLSIWNKDFSRAARVAQTIGYSVKAFTHTDGKIFYILESKDPKNRPWGTYVFYLETDNNYYVIEVPQPKDKKVNNIGVKTFLNKRNPAATLFPIAYLLSGSDGESGDVTLNSDNMFQAVHEEIAFSKNARVLQIQGVENKTYPQIILSNGTGLEVTSSETRAMDGLVDQLLQRDLTMGIFDGIQFADCGATQNAQAKFTNSIGGSFISICINSNVVKNKVIDAIQEYTITETVTVETPPAVSSKFVP